MALNSLSKVETSTFDIKLELNIMPFRVKLPFLLSMHSTYFLCSLLSSIEWCKGRPLVFLEDNSKLYHDTHTE